MKGRILKSARRVFGEYGFHGTTTRMIAEAVGIDISTLHYHWGEKGDLYEASVLDITEDLRLKLIEVERAIHGRPLAVRLDMAIDLMTDYLFEFPEISNLILLRYFGKIRSQIHFDFHVPEFISGIARSMDLSRGEKDVPAGVKMQILTIMNAIHNFVSGENFFRPMLGLEEETYRLRVKETLKFIIIPAFNGTNRRDEAPE
ncbi:MAG: TetR/AcrR family transcriptional regulator [Deltaproteobacteria bacterium]|nr:TetR/AcrR family transcriptional regulator [Deltaproteobacteria bacterium]